MATAPEQRDEVAAGNQSLWRNVNENIKIMHDQFGVPDQQQTFLCECAHSRCGKSFEMTPKQYESVRADPTCFVVAPSAEHVIPEVEVVVARDEDFWIVQKFGASAEVATDLDPRGSSAPGGPPTGAGRRSARA